MATIKERHPELFKPDLQIDRQSGIRTVPMEVMNLGFPRTGTMCEYRRIPNIIPFPTLLLSLQEHEAPPLIISLPTALQTALSILGYRCYHSMLWFSNIRDCAAWNVAQDAKFFLKGTQFTKKEWDALLGTFSAVSADPPAVAFAEELISTYPEAKIILVERDIEAWYSSFNKAVMEPSWSPFLNFLRDWDPWSIGPVRDAHSRWIRGWWKANSKDEMQDKARDMYRNHYELVRRITPPDSLLEYKLGDGWEPFCAFSGKEVPEVVFPRVNDQKHMQEFLGLVARRSMKNGLWNVGRVLLPVVAVVCAIWWVWPSK
ncbi:hypothetical protein IMSHALPRED_011046 [Imshaugia aleurites]|uniref:Uncharacterized protein n=1 Tax=Imshaugia aleurites TaxID=172621 RepID=A0A8H3IXP2_9LECA|nr:hypothetical protein IMSHALPRED_011046 [Imshaugia aleurites]